MKSTLGIIIHWESTQNVEDLKKDIINKYLREYKDLETFLEKTLLETKEVKGYDYK